MQPNYIQELGNIAIASRLKQFTDLLIRDMVTVYKKNNVDFEPRWFTTVHLLKEAGQLSITEISRKLNQSHVAINQVANALEKNNLIKSSKDNLDSRKRLINLSKNGLKLADNIQPLWVAVKEAVDELMAEAGCNILDDISKIENQLIQKSMKERILDKIDQEILKDLKIIPYKPVLKHTFIELNLEWLEKYFEVELYDRKLLFNPDEEIINKGGHILLADYKGQIIGTAAILKVNSSQCELTKMTVTEKYQGHKVGAKILSAMIDLAIKQGYKKMTLLTSPKLIYAIKLYKSFGFKESHTSSILMNEISRPSILFELELSKIN
ncbi:MAG: bifunctional helix-turn-helix transcriptional regulator/GNAT family N-acetyltransferase [Bacteroidales bacterium]|nr:bifunctional helix-turn-helix transcriptional regulator/GNAT family N-acetyltransferase [Bacteroidales bacterium]